jgi:hypothetical protein
MRSHKLVSIVNSYRSTRLACGCGATFEETTDTAPKMLDHYECAMSSFTRHQMAAMNAALSEVLNEIERLNKFTAQWLAEAEGSSVAPVNPEVESIKARLLRSPEIATWTVAQYLALIDEETRLKFDGVHVILSGSATKRANPDIVTHALVRGGAFACLNSDGHFYNSSFVNPELLDCQPCIRALVSEAIKLGKFDYAIQCCLTLANRQKKDSPPTR